MPNRFTVQNNSYSRASGRPWEYYSYVWQGRSRGWGGGGGGGGESLGSQTKKGPPKVPLKRYRINVQKVHNDNSLLACTDIEA